MPYKNIEDRRAYDRLKSSRLVKRNKAYILNFLENSACEKCGFDNPCCLDFHHSNPDEKEYTLSRMAHKSYSLERIQREIDKCQILCANCHRLEHNS